MASRQASLVQSEAQCLPDTLSQCSKLFCCHCSAGQAAESGGSTSGVRAGDGASSRSF